MNTPPSNPAARRPPNRRRRHPALTAVSALTAAALGLSLGACVPGTPAGSGPTPPGAADPIPTVAGADPTTTAGPAADPGPRRDDPGAGDPTIGELAGGAGRRVALPVILQPGAGGDPAPPVEAAPPVEVPSATVEATLPDPPAGGPCAGIAARQGDALAVGDAPFVFFGINAQGILDAEYPEARVEQDVQSLAALGVNTLRVWFFHHHDPERLARLLDIGARHGVRFVVTLEDNVFKGIDFFFSKADESRYRPHVDATVARFKDRPEILMWELINEPNCGDGKHDDECIEQIRDWLKMMARRVKAIDACHVVSTGMIGDGNYENEERSYRMIHRTDAIEILSVHKRSADTRESELELAADEDRPIFYGEIYDEVFDEGCQTLGGDRTPDARAERIKADLRQAIDDGVDGYLLWDFAPGIVGKKTYCSKFGYGLDDPVWGKLRRSEEGLPPPVPWHR